MDFTSDKTTDIADETLSSGDFFPDISLRHYQQSMLTDGKVTTERLRHALVNAITEVNRELAGWKRSQTAAGFASLEAVPSGHINNDSELMLLYRRSVYSGAKATLTERYRDTDTTDSGEKKAAALSETVDDLWRDMQWAIQRIKGESHNICELI
ncbi:head completion/stabilization protein [Morganella morganii]|uniref:head completion/stabilization protein n=1 Tax=Morganella morganii TaxID=582 RepID=UPI00237EA828|nr:head completion/stabilization protein [Morganella morganii]EKQ1115632.1 head completion/stabilization protein [Morganella morganii]MDE2535452.1 head completion/stabilization protein [Morganella morganii]HCL5895532.1 head completion/stabilization protein [Morganella morganii]HEI8451907.1 head completion/stabilization protein [Morganella morganii]